MRLHARRGASLGRLHRLAGSARDWQWLNRTWDIDGTAALLPPEVRPSREIDLDDLVELTQAERRIAIAQIAGECVEAGAAFPSPHKLAGYFGCDPRSILNDLRWMRVEEP